MTTRIVVSSRAAMIAVTQEWIRVNDPNISREELEDICWRRPHPWILKLAQERLVEIDQKALAARLKTEVLGLEIV